MKNSIKLGCLALVAGSLIACSSSGGISYEQAKERAKSIASGYETGAKLTQKKQFQMSIRTESSESKTSSKGKVTNYYARLAKDLRFASIEKDGTDKPIYAYFTEDIRHLKGANPDDAYAKVDGTYTHILQELNTEEGRKFYHFFVCDHNPDNDWHYEEGLKLYIELSEAEFHKELVTARTFLESYAENNVIEESISYLNRFGEGKQPFPFTPEGVAYNFASAAADYLTIIGSASTKKEDETYNNYSEKMVYEAGLPSNYEIKDDNNVRRGSFRYQDIAKLTVSVNGLSDYRKIAEFAPGASFAEFKAYNDDDMRAYLAAYYIEG